MGAGTTGEYVLRNVRFRLLPRTRGIAARLHRVGNVYRWWYNHMLELVREDRALYHVLGIQTPFPNHFNLCARYKAEKDRLGFDAAVPSSLVRSGMRYLAESITQSVGPDKTGAPPRFRARGKGQTFTIETAPKIAGSRLYVPKCGWVDIRGLKSHPYRQAGEVRQVVVTEELGKWYATVCFRLPAEARADDGLAIGIDCNIGHIDASTGDRFVAPSEEKLRKQLRREQRRLRRQKTYDRRIAGSRDSNRAKRRRKRIAKKHRRLANLRKNFQHQLTRQVADSAHTCIVEDLKLRNMTRSAKGSAEEPGKNVRAKSAINRGMLATGAGAIRHMLEYKCGEVIAVAPHHTSQTCKRCGAVDARSRKGSNFKCAHCGHRDDADINAALNILARGTRATGRGGAKAMAAPMKRQCGGIKMRSVSDAEVASPVPRVGNSLVASAAK